MLLAMHKGYYNQCSFYPLNHFDTGRIVFNGDYTYIKGGKKSQIGYSRVGGGGWNKRGGRGGGGNAFKPG